MNLVSSPSPNPTNWPGVRKGLENAAHDFHRKDYHQARAELQQILEFAPMESRAWQLLGRVMQAMGEHEQALKAFRNAVDLYESEGVDQSRQPATSLALAKLLWQQGDRDLARSMLDRMIAPEKSVDPRILELRQAWGEGT